MAGKGPRRRRKKVQRVGNRAHSRRNRAHSRRNPRIIALFSRQNGVCYLCEGPMRLALGYENTATVDHVVPLARCSLDVDPLNNTRAACRSCNEAKADMSLAEYREKQFGRAPA